ncbi:hypothetical protein HDR61_00795 [bacterium]|nr:hypothetical protein [bacterium]
MAIPLIETLGDLLSASSGALVGAVVTGLFNRGRNKSLSERVMAGQQELERQQMENERLLAIIKDKESTIMQMQMDMLAAEKVKPKPKKTIRRK